ncbi:MAG: hypothetical protein JWO35_873 [Candidatus Saccharibacteria bacterium]|nr:hypothetical protein [Candidatus Saccharibacteria bacterium]
MSANIGREQEFAGLQQDWEAVGGYLSTAMQEVALGLGGEDLASKVALVGASDSALPNPGALKMLEDLSPGSAEFVMTRMTKIQQETHQRKVAEMRKPSLRKYGKAVLDGFASFNIFGNLPRKR